MSRTVKGRVRLLLVVSLALAGLVAGAAALGRYARRKAPAPEPPALALDGMDPEAAAAVEKAAAAVRDAPRDGKAWGRLGMLLFACSANAEASVCFGHAERLDPDDGRWSYLLAVVAPDDPEASLRRLERAARLCDDPAPRFLLGETLSEQGRRDEAADHFRRALERQPGHPRGLLGLARVACGRGDWRQARELLRQAAAVAPNVRPVRALLAEVSTRLGDDAGAAAEVEALARLPDSFRWSDPYLDEASALVAGVGVRVARAARLLREDRVAEGLAQLEQVARQYPDAFEPRLALAQHWLGAGDDRAAEGAFREAIRRKPDATYIHNDLGLLLLRRGDHAGAADCFRAVTRLQKQDARAYLLLGQCLKQQKDVAGAAAAFRDAAARDPGSAEAHKALGELLADEGRRAEAVAALEQAVRLAPSDRETKQRLERLRNLSPNRDP